MKNTIPFTLAVMLFMIGVEAWAQTGEIDVTSLGAKPDGSDPTGTAAAFNNAFQQYPNSRIVVPPGIYVIDNKTGPIWIRNFHGELVFEGNARLIFQDSGQGGLHFVGGSGVRVSGLRGTYATAPRLRSQDEFDFDNVVDLTISNSIADRSRGIGFLLTQCIRPKLSDIWVTDSLADGVAFANCQDVSMINYTSNTTADNGLAFYDYSYLPELTGGTVRNVHIMNSTAHGIAVAGTSDVVVSGFSIDVTRGSALWVSQDHVYSTRVAKNVVIEHGTITNAGAITPQVTNAYGVEYTNSDHVLFSDIKIVSPVSRAVTGSSPTGHIYFRDITALANQQNDAFVFNNTARVELDDCVSEQSPNNGFSFDGVNQIIARNLKVVDSSGSNSLHRAIWFQNARSVLAGSLSVIDDRSTPLGYVIGASDTPTDKQHGSVIGISSAFKSGALGVDTYSPHVAFVDAN